MIYYGGKGHTFSYEITDGNAVITKLSSNGSVKEYNGFQIPSEVDGKPVTEIGDSACTFTIFNKTNDDYDGQMMIMMAN